MRMNKKIKNNNTQLLSNEKWVCENRKKWRVTSETIENYITTMVRMFWKLDVRNLGTTIVVL